MKLLFVALLLVVFGAGWFSGELYMVVLLDEEMKANWDCSHR